MALPVLNIITNPCRSNQSLTLNNTDSLAQINQHMFLSCLMSESFHDTFALVICSY